MNLPSREPSHRRALASSILLVIGALSSCAASADPAGGNLQETFAGTIRPFLNTYCVSCHGKDEPKGELDLTPYATMELAAKDAQRWKLVLERLEAGEMPPKKAKKHPTPEQRTQIVTWIRAMRAQEATRNAGDPGPVFARRLSNVEYDYTIRDLTGIDIRPAREFPVDPANQAGFDNSSESLTMTPVLVKKYLEAARRVADHLVLKPTGIEFAPHPVVADTDRDKFCVNRIVGFYKRQKTDYADYFHAAWQYRHRAALGKPNATLGDIAADSGISAKYVATIWSVLTQTRDQVGPIAALQLMWDELPAPDPKNDPKNATLARDGCEKMRDFVVDIRAKLVPRVDNLTAPRIQNGSQPLVLWKDRAMAANRRRYTPGMELVFEGLPAGSPIEKMMAIPEDPAAFQRYEATFERFCSTFPDAFYISERARVYMDPEKEKSRPGRLLSAGFHSQMGYFRDDQPLYDLILSEDQQKELDRRWQELDFIASAPIRQYTGFIWFERTDSSFMRDPEFHFARAEDKDCISVEKMKRLEEVYIAKATANGASETALQAIHRYFKDMSATFRWLEQAHKDAEPTHLAALQELAARAYRRPLTQGERQDLLAFYGTLRDKEGLTHEEAMRDTLASVLMSPHFCYRLDLPQPGVARGTVASLDDYALASRLSYFLWSSMPDQPLLDLAAAGQLRKPEVLAAQARRMLKDPRVRGLATEFAGNWLDFRRFQETNSVDRQRFPSFDNDLRAAMFEEPIRFFMDVAASDRGILDFLYADHTFVNAALAKHYGMAIPNGAPDQWHRIDNAGKYGRGGLLPMAAFLTRNSPGLRTSPVKRGYWVVKRILGEHIPPPPPTVPELPADEAKLGDLTLRQSLERHRADPGCAACHQRFDSMGLVFEGYGPIGEFRTKDLGGKPVQISALFPDGAEHAGLQGLRSYIRQHRQSDFVDHLCREVLAYGLGRTLLLSDEPAIAAMKEKLSGDGFRFGNLVEAVITSRQFMYKRVSQANEPQASKE